MLYIMFMHPLLNIDLTNSDNIKLIKLSLHIAVIPLLLLSLIRIWVAYAKIEWLERLERKIVVENISVREIEEIFIKELIGEPLSNWLKRKENEINSLTQEFEDLSSNMKTKITKIQEKFVKIKKTASCDVSCEFEEIEANLKDVDLMLDESSQVVNKFGELSKEIEIVLRNNLPEEEFKLTEKIRSHFIELGSKMEKDFQEIKESIEKLKTDAEKLTSKTQVST